MSETENVPNQPQPYQQQQNGNGQSYIGPQSWMPVAWIAAICVTLLGVKSWLDAQFDALRTQVVQMQIDVREVRTAVGDRWTSSDMALWVERMARSNPNLTVPAAESPRRSDTTR